MNNETIRRHARAVLVLLLMAVSSAFAQTGETRRKVAVDLQNVVTGGSIAGSSWARDTSAGRMAKVLVVAKPGVDPDLAPLRSAIVSAGGSVYYRYISVNGLLALLPVSRVYDIAARTDVDSISPNRLTARTASLLEKATGVAEVRGSGGGLDVDGSGVGIAFLDSGIMDAHKAFSSGGLLSGSRVKKSVDLTKANEGAILGSNDWKGGSDYSKQIYPGSSALNGLENLINNATNPFPDPYGHGTLVASIAAGRSVSSSADSTGVAPGASLYDVRVLNGQGLGDIADTLAGIDWVILHSKEYNIRVLNMSLAADSTESYLTDPLCRAVRNAVAAGITVVVAAGNYGLGPDGRERYGTITSPGNEPSAITVGSANPHDSSGRADDTVNFFSSRGPTRGGSYDTAGVRQPDNILKPDLVAPGQKLIGALSTDILNLSSSRLSQVFPQLVMQRGLNSGLMVASGTSFSAPVVSGTVALMLQANPGLTPPLVKAILQYTAEALPGQNLVQQGAGLVNVAGALQLATSLAPDIATRISQGQIAPGDSMLAAGKSMPAAQSTIDGRTVTWSRVVFLGGDQIYTGSTLFTKFQGVYQPRISWVRGRVRTQSISYFDSARNYIVGFDERIPSARKLVTAGVVQVGSALGTSSFLAGTGIFMPTTGVTLRIAGGAGLVIAEGVSTGGDGVVIAEGLVVAEGVGPDEGVVIAEGLVMAEGMVIAEGFVVAEQGPMPGE
ncbi:MAG TPA: S8 family serine peptidase [Usitatibacter sp.]|nr:S8 family serine peptidase [Usitatibacter sp.]